MDEVEFHAPPRESKSKRWLSFHPFSGIVSTRWEQKEQFCIISVTRMVCPHQQRLENGTVTILWWLSSVGNCRYRGIGLDDSITFPTEEHETEKTFPDFPGLFFGSNLFNRFHVFSGPVSPHDP